MKTDSEEKQKNFWYWLYCGYSALFLIILMFFYNTIDMDYWARVLQGNAFWQTGHILKQDPFSYTPTHLWLDHEWGSGVIFSFFQNHFGFAGILVLKFIILWLIFLLIYKTLSLREENKNPVLEMVYFFAIAFSIPTLTHSGLRCHFFTFLFFTLFLYILEKVRKDEQNKLLFLLPLIMLFWCNIHGGCVSGLGLIGMYAVGEFLNKKPVKKYFITLIACVLMLFINPYGIDYVKFIFMATTMARPFVTEWISPFAHSSWDFLLVFKVFYLINILVLLTTFKDIKKDFTKYIVLLACAYLSFKFVKNTPFFIIVSTVFLYENVQEFLQKFIPEKLKSDKVRALFIATSIILFSIIFCFANIKEFSRNYLSQQPYKVVEFLKINDLKGKVLAPFDMGSYIAYKRYPDNLIYMDGRYEEVYFKETKDLSDDFYNVQNEGYKILDTNPDYIITPADALVNDFMEKLNSYKLIYKDEDNWLYAKEDNIKPEYIIPSDDYKYYSEHTFDANYSFK